MSDDQTKDSDDDIDRAEFSLPDGRFSISGASNGKLSLCVGIATIIVAIGWTVANIVDSIWGK